MAEAESYDAYLVPAIFEPWSRDLIQRAQVWKGDRVLDVATGTGIVACRIAATGASVTAIDPDVERLAFARQRAADENVSVKWIEGSAEALPFRQPAFELVTCQQGIQWMGDRAAAVREMRRVIVPGGRLVLSTWCPVERQGAFAITNDCVIKRKPDHIGQGFSFGDEAALRKLLVDARFFHVAVETVTRQMRIPDPARFATTILAGKLEGDALASAVAEATERLAQLGDPMQFPMLSFVAVARVKT